MASPTSRETGRTATLAQNLTSSGTETSVDITVNSNNAWGNIAGTIKVGTGTSSEWITFTGVTTNSSTSQTLTGCTRGIDQDATSSTDATAGNKKSNSIGAPIKLVYHSYGINEKLQKNADDTITGTLSFNNTTETPFMIPGYTTAERDALSTANTGALILNETTGLAQFRVGGNWEDLTMTTTTSFMTDSAAGTGQLATSAEKQALTANDSVTSAPLLIGNDDTERTLHPSNTNTTDTMVIGGGSTGDRATSFSLDGSDSNAGFVISRATGANGTTTITSNGTGDVDLTSGGAISLTSAASQDITITAGSGGSIELDGPLVYGTNGGYVAESYTAGETLAADDWVYLKSSDGKVWKAANSADETAQVLGVVITGGAADATVTVQTAGIFTTTGLTANSSYYLSTAGAITATHPAINSSSVVPVKVGDAVSTTLLHIKPQRIPRRIFGTATQGAGSTTTLTLTVGFPISYAEFSYFAGSGDALADLTGGDGFYDAKAGTQGSVYFQIQEGAANQGSVQTSYAIYVIDVKDGSGQRQGTASVNGSDNIEIAWTDSVWNTGMGSLGIKWVAYELI